MNWLMLQLVVFISFPALIFAIDATELFQVREGHECSDREMIIQGEDASASLDACMSECLKMMTCFTGDYSNNVCRLRYGACDVPSAKPGVTMFSKKGFRRCFLCKSGSYCGTASEARTCYTLGRCARNNGEGGIWQQACGCDPSMTHCCDQEYCNCIGDQCNTVEQTHTRVAYGDVYSIYAIWYRKVNNGKAMENPLKPTEEFNAALPFMNAGAGMQARAVGKAKPSWGNGPSW